MKLISISREGLTCLDRAKELPEFQRIGQFMPPLNGNEDPRPELLSNNSLPTESQAEDLKKVLTRVYDCKDKAHASIQELDANLAKSTKELDAESRAVFSDLINRKISWGEAAKTLNNFRKIAKQRLETAVNAATGSSK